MSLLPSRRAKESHGALAQLGAPLRLEPLRLDSAVAPSGWIELAERSGNLFATWEFTSLWWRHYGAGKRSLAVACRDDAGDLVAILPAYLWRERPLRIARLVGHGAADILGPICAVEDRPRAALAIRALVEQHHCHALVAEQLPGDSDWAALIPGATTVEREAAPSLRMAVGDGWPEYLATRSGKLRKQIRHFENRIARDFTVALRRTETQDELSSDLDALFRLHRARWAGKETAFTAGFEAFHRDFAAAAFELGWLRLAFLEFDKRPAAVAHAFRYAGAEWDYQSGRDPQFDRYSPGHVLQARTIREALDDGICDYRLLRGGEAYKYRFTNRDDGLVTIALARGVAARAALRAAVTVRAARRRLRRVS